MTDEDRIRLAIPSGGRMLGPTERERCPKHRTRWVMYRWTWDPPDAGDTLDDKLAAISCGEPEYVRGCGTCEEEDDGE